MERERERESERERERERTMSPIYTAVMALILIASFSTVSVYQVMSLEFLFMNISLC